MYMHHVTAMFIERPEDTKFLETGVTGGWELPGYCWELTPVFCKKSKCS